MKAVRLALACVALTAALTGVGGVAAAQEQLAANSLDSDLSRLSIEELSQLEVASVSKHAEPLAHAAAAIQVLTGDEILRSGVQTLPEALRLAPNLEVMRVDALDYTITARGFGAQEAANKLLVVIDGRSVYTPLYSGVDWDQHNVVLGDLDRIEVISGPGGTLWGANAVNGVINVISKSAYDTQGVYANATAGTLDSDATLRVGGQIGDGPAWRLYASGYRRGDLKMATGADATDSWDGVQGGFRADWRTGQDLWTLQGDINDNRIDNSLGFGAGFVRTHNILGRWSRELERGGALEIQAYYDSNRRQARGTFDALDTWDVQGQYAFKVGETHKVVAGAGYRQTDDTLKLVGTTLDALNLSSRETSIGNVFIQDEIALRDDVSLTLGVKWEDNNYTGGALMPNARLAWRLSDRSLLWGAVSRAIRSPSRIERDFFIAGVVEPGFFENEELIAYEVGYRSQPLDNAHVSVSLFYNDYDGLRTNDLAAPATLPIRVANTSTGKTYGVEFAATYDVTDRWRLSGGLTLLGKELELKPGSLDIAGFESGGTDPNYWVTLRSEYQLTDTLNVEVRMRTYDKVPTLTAGGYTGVPAYTEADARLAWRVRPNVELSLTGQNLLDSQHPEASETRRTEIPRSLHAGLRWIY